MSAPVTRIGVDVGGTWLRVLAQRDDGTRGDVVREPIPGTYEGLLERTAHLAADAAGGRPAAVVCGLPGTSQEGRPRFVPALAFLEGHPLADELAHRLGAPVRLGFDGHLTLLAEAREGAARAAGSAALLAVGTGVGGAIMVGRRIWPGHHGSAGAFGWLPVAATEAAGGHGAFELVASGVALDGLAGRRRPGERGADLVEAARQGEPGALEALGRYASALGVGVAAIASILDPDMVLLAGGLSAAWDVLGPLVRATLERHASPDGRRVRVAPAALGADAGAIGALLAAGLEDWLQC